MKIYKVLKLFVLICLLGQFHNQLSSNVLNKINQYKEQLFKQRLNKLITKNVVWARSYIIADLTDLPDKNAIKERLLKNQQSFGKLLKHFYGKKSSDKLTELLREHKKLTFDLIEAIKINNKNQSEIIEQNWYKNIKDIAIFINKLNSNLSVDYLFKLLSGLLKLTKQEITLRAHKEWKKDIQNFDKILNYASYMADNLSKVLTKK